MCISLLQICATVCCYFLKILKLNPMTAYWNVFKFVKICANVGRMIIKVFLTISKLDIFLYLSTNFNKINSYIYCILPEIRGFSIRRRRGRARRSRRPRPLVSATPPSHPAWAQAFNQMATGTISELRFRDKWSAN